MIKLCTILDDAQFNYFELMIESYHKTQYIKHPWILFDCGLSDKNLSKITDNYPDITIKEINYDLYDGVEFQDRSGQREWSHGKSGRGVYNAAYRFDIFLEEEPEWLFYIDSDVLFVNDVSDLFDIRRGKRKHLMDHADIIAAPRSWEVYGKFFESGEYSTKLGKKQYINAGIMGVRNTVRTTETHKQLVDMCKEKCYAGNQQPLNEILIMNKWRLSLLTPWHNMQTEMWGVLESSPGLDIEKIKILHFTGPGNRNAFNSRGDFYKSLGPHYQNNKQMAAKIYDTYVRPAVVKHNLDVSC